MNLATLKVEGDGVGLTKVRKLLALSTSTEWEKGDPKRRGGEYHTSGFVVTIADSAAPYTMMVRVRHFLRKCKDQGLRFSNFSGVVGLSVGVTVDASTQFAAYVNLTVDDIAILKELELAVDLTVYSRSDETVDNGVSSGM
jgi:hypothetical protein